MTVGFEYPQAFLFLFAFPVIFILRKCGALKAFSLPLTVSDWKGGSFRWNARFMYMVLALVRFLWAAVFIMLTAALAGPVVKVREKVFISRGTDIMFAVDTSPSMAAADMGGISRLDAARSAIRALTSQAEGASFGLTALASEAAVLVPPTADSHFFLDRLDGLIIGELGDGSALGMGLSVAVYHLAGTAAPKKCIILLTDGENNAGLIHPNTAARLAAENGINVYAVGIGSAGSVQIHYVDPKTGREYSGLLDSRFDESSLRGIAAAARDAGGSGSSYYAVSQIQELTAVLSSIAAKENTAQASYFNTVVKRYYHILLFCAGAAVVLAWIIRHLYLRETI